MPRTWRTPLVVVASLTVCALTLTGCGRADDSGGPSAEVGAAIDDGPASGTITVWAMGTEGELLPELVKAFEADNPDAQVDVTAIPWQDYAKKVETAVASGNTPDLTMIGQADLASIIATDGFEPVPDGVADDAAFFDAAREASRIGETVYAVPWYVETSVLFYRKDLAAAAGVEAPKTWEELRTFAAALQGAGAKWGLSVPTGAPNTWSGVVNYMWQAGATFTKDDLSAFTIQSPEALAGFEYYGSLIADGLASPNGPVNLGEIEPQFVSGEVGAFMAGPWEIGLLRSAGGESFLAEKVGVTTMPAGPASSSSVIGGGGWGVFQDAKNRDGAWKLVRWLSEAATQEAFFELSGDLPSNQDAWKAASIQNDTFLPVFEEQLRAAAPTPPVETWLRVTAVIESEMEKVAKGVSCPAS